MNFWDSEAWGFFMLLAVLLASMLFANIIKKNIPFLQKSLIPTSVVGGLILLIVAWVFKSITDVKMFNTSFFGGNGTENLRLLTYHMLALGFIASSFKRTGKKLTKERSTEIFNTGVTTVSTYLIQAIVGLIVTIIAALFISGFFSGSGILLAFGFGQGTGQAMNWGSIYENYKVEEGLNFAGGENFGLTVAAIGFLCAAIGGVIHINIMKHSGKLVISEHQHEALHTEDIEDKNEIPMQESIDKMTIQIAFIAVAYLMTYGMMEGLSALLPGMKSTIYGFNFLLGVIAATFIKLVMNFLMKKKIMKKEYTNNFLMTRASNFFFDIMVVAGIAVIDLDMLEDYWGVVIILAVLGFLVTYFYNRLVAKLLFPKYKEEQFLMMYGMLTGTASTGVILLREIDGDFKTPASENLVYQNLPAIVFGFPLMLLAELAPENPLLLLLSCTIFFVVMNLILFRKFIFRRRKK